MKHSEFLCTNFAFGHLAANVRVRCSDFSKLSVYAVYSNQHPPSLFGEHSVISRWRTLRKELKRWWGRPEKRRMATESGGDEMATRPATRRRRRLVTNETAATGGRVYTDEEELEFDEDEMAELEGQRLVAEFRCGIY